LPSASARSQQAVLLDRVEDGEGRRAGDRVAAERAAVLTGPSSCAASPNATQAPRGSPPPSPFARVITSGRTSVDWRTTTRATDAGLHLVDTSSAPCWAVAARAVAR
jgi:hypothetical protein